MNSKAPKSQKITLNASTRKCSVTPTTSGVLTAKSSTNLVGKQAGRSSQSPLTLNMDSNNDDLYPYVSRPDSFQLDEALHWSQTQFSAQFHLLAKRLPIEHIDNQLQLLHALRRLLRVNPYAG
jgi:hypothetical protein